VGMAGRGAVWAFSGADERGAAELEQVSSVDALIDELSSFDFGADSSLWDFSLVHGDFHANNLLVRPSGDIAVIDFQILQLGEPASDLGKFLCLGARILIPKQNSGIVVYRQMV
jgi:aminoglycoside phosphotransferase (APT) family kinase protein